MSSKPENLNFRTVPKSARAAHQVVSRDGQPLGEVWREQTRMVVSKLTEPRRVVVKWRWFAKSRDGVPLGRGTRAAMLLGAGFKAKGDAAAALLMCPVKEPSSQESRLAQPPALSPLQRDVLRQALDRAELSPSAAVGLARAEVALGHFDAAVSLLRPETDRLRAASPELAEIVMYQYPNA